MGQWKVNQGTQVAFAGNLYGPGDTFEASDGEVTAEGFGSYVTKMKPSAPKLEPAVEVMAPSKAMQSSSNKAQQSSDNKSK